MNNYNTASLTETDKERILAILNSWHKIEFFIPFDLERSVIQDTHQYKKINWLHGESLQQGAEIFVFPDCRDGKVPSYSLFLGVFDKNEIAPICDDVLQLSLNPNDTYENKERGDLEGATCFAKIKLNKFGEPILDEISISTLPWALGVIQRFGLEGLNASSFATAQARLIEKLQNFASRRETADTPLSLTAKDIFGLRDLLYDWAQFTPQKEIAPAVLQWMESYAKSNNDNEDNSPVDAPLEPEVDILNSFLIQDIERAMRDATTGKVSRSLYEYLTPRAPSERIDIYSKEGRKVLHEKLHPNMFNHGHWFDTPEHLMSLMQQFAINMAFEANEETGIFSVNGPPGTGKTTLLRDIISENIVRRASVLASCRTAACAFDGKKQIPLGDGIWIRMLKPELTGFEMIVASSNNAAVNNISKELPKVTSLGDCWSKQTYIQPTAQKIATQNNGSRFTPLSPEESQWGLIACALGNYTNKKKFNERLCFYPDNKNREPAYRLGLLSIYDWMKQYNGPTFDEAKTIFLSRKSLVEKELEKRTEFADLVEELAGQTEESYTLAERQEVERCEQEHARIKQEVAATEQKIADTLHAIHQVKNDWFTLEKQKPGWLSRLFRLPSARKYLSAARLLKSQQQSLEADVAAANSKLDMLETQNSQANKQHQKAKTHLESRYKEWKEKQNNLGLLSQQFETLRIPNSLDELEADSFQKEGLWNDNKLSVLRAELFSAALSFHEAWLADVGRSEAKGGADFYKNIFAISNILQGHTQLEEQDALAVWQSLFMIVPVVSTTFASFASQFKNVGPNSLGWLFIDEAGQAVPQAAVGALWRTQNAVVVGDPLQIEPVFTVPANLIRSISNLSPHTEEGDYAPDAVSAQNLADACNKYGAYASSGADESQKTWIGSPLRVHRRCIDPMFSVSNNIAYEGRMIYGLPHKLVPNQPPLPFESSWVDIPGETSKQQIVPGQIEFVIKLIINMFTQHGELPKIYVISPFKAVKKELQEKLKGDWAIYGATATPPKRVVNAWCKERIGTVHTFQGKEEDCVIMVLGADQHSKIGAAQWAASKPNLLNVAITRAKKRCFIVGDKELWAKMKYFSSALGAFSTAGEKDILNAVIDSRN
jgi:hypothetical protein